MEAQGRPPGHGKLAAHQAFLEEVVAQDGDITLPELSGALKTAPGGVAHAASIHCPADCFAIACRATDETSVKTNMTRLRGRSSRGQRLEMNAPFGAWGTQTFIAGLTHDSLISPWVIKGAMDGEAFAAYIREVLAPNLQPGTVVICDNLATHRNKDAAQALKDIGCWFLYLPPYSPDLNPIEMAFSKLKAHLRRIGARTFDKMFDALAEVCDLFTPQECWNYFCEARYGSS